MPPLHKHLFFVALAGLLAGQSAFAESQSDDADHSNTTVVMLGTGTPVLKHDRAGQGILIVVDGQMYLFDAGPGYARNFDALSGKDFMPPDTYFSNDSMYGEMDKLFITHLDSDHVLGMPELLLRPWVMGRDHPVKIVGPKGTQALVDNMLKGYKDDIDHRLYGTQPATSSGFEGKVTEISEGQVVHQDDKVTVTAFRVPHGSWPAGMSFGYRVETPDKTIVLSGDTRMDEALYEHFEGADILIHEVMSETGVSQLSQDWQDYLYHAHTSTAQLAEIGRNIEPELLVMTHPLFFGQTDAQLREEMDGYYDSDFVLASDLDIYE